MRAGLSARLLLLTVLFVLIAEVLIYVPSVANFRNNWLSERLAQARAAALILEKSPPDALPRPLVEELLAGMETSMIALRIDNARRLLAVADMPPMVDFEIDLRQRSVLRDIGNAFDILLRGHSRTIRVVGPPPRGGDFVEIVISEFPLRQAMLRFSWGILGLSLIISVITAVLVFVSLNGLIVQPVKRLAATMKAFQSHPEDARSILRPTRRSDELGELESSLADMQRSLQQELRQREHLANLGLAVAKINHDLRNMLASAQLMADRISALPDPNVQRFVPKLMSALDRAIAFCQSTLAYGKASEKPADLAPVDLALLVEELGELLMLSADSEPALHAEIPPGLHVMADPDHLARVLTNLLRNARAALEAMPPLPEQRRQIRIVARHDSGATRIAIMDNGPGVPDSIRERLFKAFTGSARPGSTGLGLAIAHELVRGMGGTIRLLENPQDQAAKGAVFEITLPGANPPRRPGNFSGSLP
ncbi:MAG: HAMP domain-containing sensor histidine kinase [Beijerinckiaceae bacterium]|nr:HAMP domain-containing sensor histidine kinase [Beijerinckiaceae bacterium]MCZ8299208.1 HAMP domain-containing sensor histidine kinase [Beijerinckiaceae bacterium]